MKAITEGSLQKQLYLPHFLTKPVDSSQFPEGCTAPREAQRGIEVRYQLDEHLKRVTHVQSRPPCMCSDVGGWCA
jgi:hypothetical protein